MKRSALLMPVVIVLLILSFVFVAANAQSEPPLSEGFTDDEPSSPYVIYPDNEEIFDKTPLFRFTDFSAYGATKYRIDVWQGTNLTVAPLYTYKGAGVCDGTECTMQPGIALKKADINGNGYYTWRVRARVAGEWPVLWDQSFLTVLSSGFTSYFDTLEKKWLTVQGTWTLKDGGYMKTLGIPGQLSSMVEKHVFTEGYTYEVKLKRKVELNSPSMILFSGNTDSLNADGYWYDGYFFSITNAGNWVLGKISEGSVATLGSGYSADIKPFDWNKLAVVRSGSDIMLYVNGELVTHASDATFGDGFVGFGMVEADSAKSALLVDWAILDYIEAPSAIP